jgi:hypothetical protein
LITYFGIEIEPDLLLRYDVTTILPPKHLFAFLGSALENYEKVKEHSSLNDHSLICCNFVKFIIIVNLFKVIKCENSNNSFSDNYWWICALIVGLILLAALIWNIWYCCDSKFEKTKEKLSKIRKKICGYYCCYNSSEELINDISSNINLEDDN